MSKFSLDVLEKHVYPFAKNYDSDVILGSTFGEDTALTRIGDTILASHVDPIVGAIEKLGWLAVHVACNDIAASGIKPRWILVLLLVPKQEDEDLLEQIMRDVGRAAEEIGVSIIGGHTGYSSGISRPLVAVTSLGTTTGGKPVRTSGARVGDSVLITKGIALEGTSILAQDFADVARASGITEQELAEAKELIQEVSVVPESMVLSAHDPSAMHDATRGGVLETLLEIAGLSGVGIEIDTSKIPARHIVSRFAEAFGFDPLKMISSGTLAATFPPERVDGVSGALKDLKIPFAFVGHVSEGEGVSVIQEGTAAHFTGIRCEEDELARMWAIHPRNR